MNEKTMYIAWKLLSISHDINPLRRFIESLVENPTEEAYQELIVAIRTVEEIGFDWAKKGDFSVLKAVEEDEVITGFAKPIYFYLLPLGSEERQDRKIWVDLNDPFRTP